MRDCLERITGRTSEDIGTIMTTALVLLTGAKLERRSSEWRREEGHEEVFFPKYNYDMTAIGP